MHDEATGSGPATGLPTLDAEGIRPPGPPAKLPGAIGGFPILGKLGEGGMGIVYEAEQQSPRRRVALKVVRGGHFVDEEYLRMFRREAETLARLSHPNIAAIYEAGRTEDGQHFFTMELVRGRTLSGYARERLGGERPGPEALKERLRLFGTICLAVNYAHQRGVIHRDLKPSNVVVSETGEVKILDFGLARITDADVAVGTILSEIGTIRGTLPYMSPEQARGDSREIDFRTDVYSLGVLLYELISGRYPYETLTVSLVSAVRTICEEPPRPLRAAGGTAVDPDLVTIVAKALEKNPEQRYQSAAALAEDVERYLGGEPILAHPPSAMYQLRKLAARNKGGVAAVSAIALLLVALAVTMTVQAQRVRRERDRAAAEAAKASAINAFLQEALGAADPWGKGSRNVTLLDALKQARAKVETAFRGQPLVEAAVLQTIGTTLTSLAEYEEAESALKRSLELREAAAGRRSDEAAASLEALSGLYESWRKYDESERSGKEAYEIRKALHGRESLEAAASLASYATPVRRKGRLDEAKGYAEEALRIARDQAEAGGRATEAATRVEDDALDQLNFIATERQDWAESERLASERVATFRARYPGGHPRLSAALNDLAVATLYRKDLARAETLFKEAIAMSVATLGEDHPETASHRENLGNVTYQLGRLDETARSLEAVLDVRRRVLGDDSEAVARTLANMGSVQKKAGQVDAASRSFEEAAARFERIFGPEHPDLGTALFGLADSRRLQKRFPESETLFLRALAIHTKAIGETSPMTQLILKAMALLYTDWDKPEKAAACRARLVPPPGAPAVAPASPAAAATATPSAAKVQ